LEVTFQQTSETLSKVLFLLEAFLAHPADRAGPALRNLLPGSAGGNAVVRITYGGIIDIAAGANILTHANTPLTESEVTLQQAGESLAVTGFVMILLQKTTIYSTDCQ